MYGKIATVIKPFCISIEVKADITRRAKAVKFLVIGVLKAFRANSQIHTFHVVSDTKSFFFAEPPSFFNARANCTS